MSRYGLGSVGVCKLCGLKSNIVSNTIGVCTECLRRKPKEALRIALEAHKRWRSKIGLPPEPPKGGDVKCRYCVNECEISEDGVGYCGVNKVVGKRIVNIGSEYRSGLTAIVHWYLDPHPTNCVAAPVCPANTCAGYPRWTKVCGIEYGYYNLAVFFAGCSLDCLFCQNWEHKTMLRSSWSVANNTRRLDEIIRELENDRVTCVCFFGGDPTPHAPWALAVARHAVRLTHEGFVKRVCWETNGVANPSVMKEMAKTSLETGGIVKIDFKAWTPSIYQALTGVDAVERVKDNVKLVADMWLEEGKPEPPLLVVSILLVPGYVDVEEVRSIARYVASIDPDIPIILLAFHPEHLLRDLPTTSWSHALKAAEVAKEAGVRRVFIGNSWLLSNAY